MKASGTMCAGQEDQHPSASPPDSPDGRISAGTVLAGRFRIVRRVGAGGMGDVYEAADLSLDRRVAIKCARAGHSLNLPPEARAAREVSHFNVCKVYDLHTAALERGEMHFLSMEFVDGETLSSRIRRGGPLKPREALELARQICAGLDQAHRQGVVHGDLKPANVILAQAAGGVRAVITDFGLAKFAIPDGSPIASPRGGTLDYMAPELFRGESASPASDIYALGVLIHVMLTGHAPRAPLKMVPPDATTLTMQPRRVQAAGLKQIADLPRPWRSVVARCLEERPERRYRSARLVIDALAPGRRRWRWPAAGLAIAAGIGYWQAYAPSGPPMRLAVLPFRVEQSAGMDLSPVALDIAERLAGAGRNFTVISPVEAQQNQVDSPDKARGVLGATHALQTRVHGAAGRMDIAAQLMDLESGKVVRSLQSSYPAGDAAMLAKALMGTVTAGLNLKPRVAPETVGSAAYPSYIQGLNALRGDPRAAGEAMPFLERAITLDPRSALPYAALAMAQLQKFRNGGGREWLARASETAGRASGINPDSVRVLLLSGEIDQLRGRYNQALASFNRASTLDPGNPEVWRQLAETYGLAGRDDEVVSTYHKAIDAEPGGYFSYFNLGNYFLVRGQFAQAEQMYRKVTELAPRLASGHMNLGLALKQQGHYADAEHSLLTALALRPSARLLLNLGALYYEQRRYADALKRFQESAESGERSAALSRDLGDAYRHLSRIREAGEAYRAARAQSEDEVTINPRSAAARARLALLAGRLGDRHTAAFELTQALDMDTGGSAQVIADAVQTLEILQRRDEAIALLQKSPRAVLEQLSRLPDLAELRRDPQFLQLQKQ